MKTMTVARYLEQQIAISGKSQRVIATECGYPNPNIITMFKKGRTKVPLEKVAAMARSLKCDPAYLLRLTLGEYMPEALTIITQIMGKEVTVTGEEWDLLELLRQVGSGRTPSLAAPENRAELTAAIQSTVARDDARAVASVARMSGPGKPAKVTRRTSNAVDGSKPRRTLVNSRGNV